MYLYNDEREFYITVHKLSQFSKSSRQCEVNIVSYFFAHEVNSYDHCWILAQSIKELDG